MLDGKKKKTYFINRKKNRKRNKNETHEKKCKATKKVKTPEEKNENKNKNKNIPGIRIGAGTAVRTYTEKIWGQKRALTDVFPVEYWPHMRTWGLLSNSLSVRGGE